jgi:imidazolonepropionase-like amidohydrolase
MPDTQTIVIEGGKLLDPRRDALLDGHRIVVRQGRIAEVTTDPVPLDGARVIDVRGKTVMPGLIDAHVHIYMNERNIAALGQVSQTYMAAKSTAVMHGMLMRGFTTVRDVAGGDYGMRDAIEAGYVAAPRLFMGGRAISQTGGHGDFRARAEGDLQCACCTGLSLFSVVADGLDAVIKAVREELRLGADHIKIMLSGGVASPNDPLESLQYRADEVAAAIEEAQRWGAYTCAHAYTDVAVRRAVELGVRTIEHGNFISPETAAVMAARDAYLVPTLIVYEINHRLGPDSGKSPASLQKNALVREAGLRSLEIARAAGVSIGYGTDLSMHTQQHQTEGLQLHAEVLSNAEVIRSATLTNARIVRQEGRLGELVAGAQADLLIVDGDPYRDLTIFDASGTHLKAIMKQGKFYKYEL